MDKQTLIAVIEKFGVNTQINKIQEEALELALILNQRNCPTKDSAEMEDRLYDELADMKIMMAQVELIFDSERIHKRVEYKLKKVKEKYLGGENSTSVGPKTNEEAPLHYGVNQKQPNFLELPKLNPGECWLKARLCGQSSWASIGEAIPVSINGTENTTRVSDHHIWYHMAKEAGITHWLNE